MNEVDAMVCRLGNYIVKLETALKTADAAYKKALEENAQLQEAITKLTEAKDAGEQPLIP